MVFLSGVRRVVRHGSRPNIPSNSSLLMTAAPALGSGGVCSGDDRSLHFPSSFVHEEITSLERKEHHCRFCYVRTLFVGHFVL
jgi:hypothetical protein